MIALPPLLRALLALAALSLFGVMWLVSRLLNRWLDSRARTAREIACVARLSRLRVQPTKPTAGAGASPTPAPAVAHPHDEAEVFRGADQ